MDTTTVSLHIQVEFWVFDFSFLPIVRLLGHEMSELAITDF